ncbi:hypothetical protein E2F48_02600 [Arthrobacter crusticola]|uniref:Uncharacterized protein n=1 Tax=Arthrobacter crusticola TaxID=2547960 RepID=A0A4R5U2W0_9MICC|nr:hypothetical protein [Arthrobacter crusticola]TDK28011.1 hypothetical protein E2F48_02600 [Arthrobacter crusticola]
MAVGTSGTNAPVFLAWLSGPLAVAAGLAAHAASGSQAPALALLLTLTALLGLAASMLSRLQLPGGLILVLCGLTQQLLHFAFSAFVGGSAVVVPAHGHGAVGGADGQSTALVVPGQDLHSMVYAHAAAALLTALPAARGTAMLSWARARVHWRPRSGHPVDGVRLPLPLPESGKAEPRKAGPAAPYRAE